MILPDEIPQKTEIKAEPSGIPEDPGTKSGVMGRELKQNRFSHKKYT